MDKFLRNIPNMLTFLNMALGLGAVLLVLHADHPRKMVMALILIALGGAADFLDGFCARKWNASSDMGKQLDSFADLVSFGLAPVLLVNYAAGGAFPAAMVLASMAYVMAGAYRLARFNLSDADPHFWGLPIPAAGMMLATYGVLYPLWTVPPYASAMVTALFMLALAALMASKTPVKRIPIPR